MDTSQLQVNFHWVIDQTPFFVFIFSFTFPVPAYTLKKDSYNTGNVMPYVLFSNSVWVL